MAEAVRFRSLGTFEFLVDGSSPYGAHAIAFIEANPRLQVEHTVTEAVTGIDLVTTQVRIAGGATLATLDLEQAEIPSRAGLRIQVRVKWKTIGPTG